MASDNLLPCPFCGTALTNVQTADDGSGDIVWAVHPDKRGCWMDGYEFDWSAEGAYKPWNTRSPTGLTAWVPEEMDSETLYSALLELTRRIEACGASPELTRASSLACDLVYAVNPRINGPLLSSEAADRVRATLTAKQGDKP